MSTQLPHQNAYYRKLCGSKLVDASALLDGDSGHEPRSARMWLSTALGMFSVVQVGVEPAGGAAWKVG
jgi:hypothetical protein